MTRPPKSPKLDAQDILAWLADNPEFLERHADQLGWIANPAMDKSGTVVDLTRRIAARAREEARKMQQTNQSLLHLAAENMLHWQQLHHATLGFLACTNINSFAQMIEDELPVIFGLAGARLLMPAEGALPMAESLGFLVLPGEEINRICQARSVYLGPPAQSGPALFSVPSASMAVVRLPDQLPEPVAGSALVLGGRTPQSFAPDQGQTLLTYLAEIVGVCLLARIES
ncbi:MAG: DUF484 family protein [Alphaproteobacteria bacterium]|jgi:uncharacterized protein YigA (DUF484 family)|nr:DUF484 family protein [Alphaproteobacteria bacterium]